MTGLQKRRKNQFILDLYGLTCDSLKFAGTFSKSTITTPIKNTHTNVASKSPKKDSASKAASSPKTKHFKY